MRFTAFRRYKAPIALFNFMVFLMAMSPLSVAYAQDAPPEVSDGAASDGGHVAAMDPGGGHASGGSPPAAGAKLAADLQSAKDKKLDKKKANMSPAFSGSDTLGLPTGEDKTGVSSQAISVPSGAGTIKGMGESFSAQMSTGIGTFSVPITTPRGRGGVGASLGLSYSSSGGQGIAGAGWSIGTPFISRQTDKGLPSYDDRPNWHPNQDRFVFNGGQELVPICDVEAGGTCKGAISGEQMPDFTNGGGWQYFRARVEGSFMRFFWSPDRRRWVIQSKDGSGMVLGAIDGDKESETSLELNPENPNQIYRWCMSESHDSHWDSQGRPVNRVKYRYKDVGGMAYVTDIWDTPPASTAATAPLKDWAHHVHVRYEPRTDPTFNYRRGWRVDQTLRIQGVDVTSKPFDNALSSPRELLNRTHFAYDANYHVTLLESVHVEGRCDSPIVEDNSETLPSTNCPTLPPMRFGYEHVEGHKIDGAANPTTLPGYEPFDERLITFNGSPDHSLDEAMTGLFDVNSDSLPDIFVTNPGEFGDKYGVFFNGGQGSLNTFSPGTVKLKGVLGANPSTLTFNNPNFVPQDLDGDGHIDFLHMPKTKTYSVYSFVNDGAAGTNSYSLKGRTVSTADALDPKIDFSKDADSTRVMDINGDGLVDILKITGKNVESFLSLGRYPGGDGRFGHAEWTGASSAQLFTEPIRTCVPWSAQPIRLSDADIKLGDMNGDGLGDIVRLRKGQILYWPGRGDGYFGTGALNNCDGGGFGQDRHIEMADAPQFSDPNGASLRLDDVNGDGLSDIVQIRFSEVDIWLNVDGKSFTKQRHIIENAPAHPAFVGRIALVDMNGSGTRDLLWGDGNNYRYMDLAGGKRPWVLTHIDNGLGKTTDLKYSTTAALMLKAAKAGKPWASTMPMSAHVIVESVARDHLGAVGRPEGVYRATYEYRDPVYDGRQREFRGFRSATTTTHGDQNSPTSHATSRFLLGECVDETPNNGVDDCSLSERWRDNRREGLKGLPVISETYDDAGTYPSTAHSTYRLRTLYTGMDGRIVTHAYVRQTDSFLYDTDAFDGQESTIVLPSVEREETFGTSSVVKSTNFPLRASAGRKHTRSAIELDAFSNQTYSYAYGCIDGCASVDETITDYSAPYLIPSNPGHWLWTSNYGHVSGNQHGNYLRNISGGEFNAHGDPIVSTATLGTDVSLERFHETGQPVAAPPSDAAPTGAVQTGVATYDVFGNRSTSQSHDKKCSRFYYDSVYQHFTTSERVYLGSGAACTGPYLEAKAEYDRGLGETTAVHDVHDELTTIDFDGFGRPTLLRKPHPDMANSPTLAPSIKIEYFLTTDPQNRPISLIHTQTQDGAGIGSMDYQDAWSYIDGFGRTVVTLEEADPANGDAGPWVVNGLTEYNHKGDVTRAYFPWFWSGSDPKTYDLSVKPTTKYEEQRYDAFHRSVATYGLDGTVTIVKRYHALSEDVWDAADLADPKHYGTYASVTLDGHGRGVLGIERSHDANGQIETRETVTEYLPTGEPELIRRTRNSDPTTAVVRWMRYDRIGRMVLNVDSHTSVALNGADLTDKNTPSANVRAWRYLYNVDGDLLGTSDARGCGVNYHHDNAGRLIAEDYSPCQENHAPYSAPDLTTGDGAEVYNWYDAVPSWYDAAEQTKASAEGCLDIGAQTAWYPGRLVATADRGQRMMTHFDGRGRILSVRKWIAKPGAYEDSQAARYAPRVYCQDVQYDGADRPISETTGARVAEIMDANTNQSFVTMEYTKRGALKKIGSAYGDLVKNVVRTADGRMLELQYGDAAGTKTTYIYDKRNRVKSVQTYRAPPPSWAPHMNQAGEPTTFQMLLEDLEYTYDIVNNPIRIRDYRIPSEWPAGAKPVSRRMEYDDLYRLKKLRYEYSGGDDAWKSPFDSENASTDAQIDPRRSRPSPHVAYSSRIKQQSFQYDWLGNTTKTEDDAQGFYDRSLGDIQNGDSNGSRPYQLRKASNVNLPGASGRRGSLDAVYDVAGNMTSMAVRRSGPCLPTGSVCSQRFVYEWDEVGNLERARRWDQPLTGPPDAGAAVPTTTPAAELKYKYDGGNQRVIKTAVDTGGNEQHTVYVFASLELRKAPWRAGDPIPDYERSKLTEVAFLFAQDVRLARLVYEDNDVPEVNGSKLHVFLSLSNHMGSSSIVIDVATGELTERMTYQGYGATESDYRPDRWKNFRTDYRFTGKEEDIEVGLQYFGFRYLNSYLGRWVSADPLAIHAPGEADLNLYAYVHGRVLMAIDPLGLLEEKWAIGPTIVASYTNGVGQSVVANSSNADNTMGLSNGSSTTNLTASGKLKPALESKMPRTSTGRSITKPPPIKFTKRFENPVAKIRKDLVAKAKQSHGWVGGKAMDMALTLAPGFKGAEMAAGMVTGAMNLPALGVDVGQHFARSYALYQNPAYRDEAWGDAVIGGIKAGQFMWEAWLLVEGVRSAAKGLKGGCNCFPEGALVLTVVGYRPIESLQPGDTVVSHDVDEAPDDWHPVPQIRPGDSSKHRRSQHQGVAVSLDSSANPIEFSATDEVFVRDIGWLTATRLAVGMEIRTVKGFETIRTIESRQLVTNKEEANQ